MLLLAICATGVAQATRSEFMSLDEARPVLAKTGDLPSELKGDVSENDWDHWVRRQDKAIRERLEAGDEDTLTNLLRWGVSYTKEYRIDREYLAQYGKSTLVNSFAEHRADDLIRALASPATTNEGLIQERILLEKNGFAFKTAKDRAKLKEYLLKNLARMRDEMASFREKLPHSAENDESQLYAKRGISLDTNLWPDYALDRALRELVESGALKPASVRRVAIVGPGLDFANKENGNDFYPPQTIQPFAVIDSLLRLNLADAKELRVVTLDISPRVNLHLERAREQATAGKTYKVQLPWNSDVPFSEAYLAGFTRYWERLGDQIGSAAEPVAVPQTLAKDLHLRAVAIRPEITKMITSMDANIVFERVPVKDASEQFDLIIGTNIFIYYGRFEQMLARANVSAMLRPGGYLLTNNLLADEAPSHLTLAQTTKIVTREQPSIIERVYGYRRD
ncbi:MAG TPA: hypothetical protein VGL89_02220 [Candidatus Koribacter sp.]